MDENDRDGVMLFMRSCGVIKGEIMNQKIGTVVNVHLGI